jgi:ABC-type lipoprotein export system ATPase subunit
MIITQDLTKIYGEDTQVAALQQVNLEIARGEFVAITGPSGSGKSTLLNLLGTLDRPTEGSVCLDGVDVSTLKGDRLADFRRENIGFIFQLFHLVPVLNALENVMLPLLPYHRSSHLEGRAKELLEIVGLGDRMKHLPSQLSGGESQRVAIARALINQPGIILADEPTGNLDSHNGEEIVALLKGICQDTGITIVMVTHDPKIAAEADRTLSMRDGRLQYLTA